MSAAIFLAQTLPAQTWSQLSPSGTPPVARGLHGTTGVYDPASNRMIVFGGRDGSGNNLNDVWVLLNANGLGATSQWVNLIPNGAGGSPPARSGHAAAYDAANNVMFIFGGCSGYCTPVLNDTWMLSNANGLGGTPVWTQLPVDAAAPPARTNAVAVYDPSLNLLSVYSGQDGSADPCSTFTDVWRLTNANGLGGAQSWSMYQSIFIANDTDPFTPLPGLNGAAVAYDPATGVASIFGGMTNVSGVCRETNAAWELKMFPVPTPSTATPDGAAGSPPARSYASGVFDAAGGRLIVFGGQENGIAVGDVWALSNATGLGKSVWSKLSPSGTPPAERNSQAAIFDSANQRMTIFAGSNASGVLNDSWVLTAPGVSGLSCNANAGAPNIVRADGLAEQVGDVILNCTGGTPTALGDPIPHYTVTMTLNTNVTSRKLAGNGQLSEALLLIDEPFPANPFPSVEQGGPAPVDGQALQILCKPLGAACAETGTGGTTSPYQTQPNVFVAKQTGPATLQWTVPIDPPGVNLTRILRFTNVRVNANQLGLSGTFIPTEIQATLGIQGAIEVPISHPPQIVALGEAGIVTSVNEGNPIPQCAPHNVSLLGGAGSAAFDFSVQAVEGFGYAFKNRDDGASFFPPSFPDPLLEQNIAGFTYRSESGFYSPTLFTTAPSLGLADSGTRIRVMLGSHPDGTHLFVPVSITMTGNYGFEFGFGNPEVQGQLQLVKANENGASAGYKPVHATAMVGTTPVAEVSYAGSAAYATYEVLYADPSVTETATIPVAVAFTNSPSLGPSIVTLSLAPLDPTKTSSTSAPSPRFAAIYAARPAFSIEACTVPKLSASIVSKTGPLNARVWNIQVNNLAVHAAMGIQIDNVKVSHSSGKVCHPAISSPSFPVSLGDISPKSSIATPVTIDFTGCSSGAKFQAAIVLSANGGVSSTTIVKNAQAP